MIVAAWSSRTAIKSALQNLFLSSQQQKRTLSRSNVCNRQQQTFRLATFFRVGDNPRTTESSFSTLISQAYESVSNEFANL